MRKTENAYRVFLGCIVAAVIVLLAEYATAQTVEVRKSQRGPIVKWNNSAFFKDQPRLKAFDWKTYPETWDGKLFATWGLFAASGMLWGAREAYHADPYIFDRVYGVRTESFWGSDAWKRNYVDNDPEKPHKHEYFGNVGRDIWHTFGFSSNALLFSGAFAIGARKQPAKYRALNLILGIGARSLFASLTYNSLRAR